MPMACVNRSSSAGQLFKVWNQRGTSLIQNSCSKRTVAPLHASTSDEENCMEPHYYSMKREDQWKWDGRLSADEVIARINNERLGEDWHIVRFATDESPVDARAFAANPEIFLQRDARRDAAALRRKEIADSVPSPLLLTWGKRCLFTFFAILTIGRATITIFFPHLRGTEMTPTAWMILIPTWSLGGIGLIAASIGALQHKSRVSKAIEASHPSKK